MTEPTNPYAGRVVVLVDQEDKELGTADIFEAHQGNGLKHRALSVILYRKKGDKVELLLQKRAQAKPVFKSLWSNTCCTNMRPGDTYIERAVSRLVEEMGIVIKPEQLKTLFSFSYEAPDEALPGWCENEVDTVIVGEWRGEVQPNPHEAEDYKWMDAHKLVADIQKNPGLYAPWYRMILADERFWKALR